MRCQLCGFEYDPAQLTCHSSCPLHAHCSVICCPNCGYQVVDPARSRMAGWLGRWWRGKGKMDAAQAAPALCPLADLPLEVEAEITSMDALEPGRLARLSVYGLMPGSRVCLLQRHPACVVRTGETELALSREIVEQITVRSVENQAT